MSRNSDNMDMVYWLYNRTGDPKLLELGEKLMRTGQKWMDRIGGGHNVQTSQGFRKPAVFYQQNKDPKYLEIADSNWDALYDAYGQVPGGMFGGDEFARPGYGDPKQAIETCGAVEMMFSEQILFRITGDLKWMDRCENIAFNTFPATMTADFKALRYLTSPNQCNSDARSKAPSLANDGEMQVMNPRDHRCCQHNVGVGWPHFVESLYAGHARPRAGRRDVRAVHGHRAGGRRHQGDHRAGHEVSVRGDRPTQLPDAEGRRVPALSAHSRVVRHSRASASTASRPNWRPRAANWSGSTAPGGRATSSPSTLPMKLKVTRWEKNQNSVSINRGPLTYSIKIGEKYVRHGNRIRRRPGRRGRSSPRRRGTTAWWWIRPSRSRPSRW